MFSIPNWMATPLFAAALAGVLTLIKMWGRQDRHGDEQHRQGEDIVKMLSRLDECEKRLGAQDTVLARIDEGIKYLRESFDSALGKIGR